MQDVNVSTLGRSAETHGKTVELSFVGRQIIDLPERPLREDAWATRSREYWDQHNEAEAAYAKGDYTRAASVLGKLSLVEDLHQRSATVRLRSLRKLRDLAIRKKKLAHAFEISQEMLSDSQIPTTATDDRTHNKIAMALGEVGRLVTVRASAASRSKILQTEIELRTELGWTIEARGMKSPPDKGSSRWRHRLIADDGTIEIAARGLGPFGDDIATQRAVVRFHDAKGNASPLVDLEEVAYRVGWHPSGRQFATLGEQTLSLIVYDLEGRRIRRVSLTDTVDDKYHVRAVATSTFGDLSTSAGHAYLTAPGGLRLWSARTPLMEGWERRMVGQDPNVSAEQRRAAGVLNVAPSAQRDAVVAAYRAQARQHHPDLNPGDDAATARMQEINWAYEVLTGERAEDAFHEMEETYREMGRHSIEIEGAGSIEISFGMVGGGEDWIYSASIDPFDGRVYLGCYSGRVFALDRNGQTLELLDAHMTVDGITPLAGSLLLRTATTMFAVADNRLVGEADVERKDSITYHSRGFVVHDKKTLELFDDRCVLQGIIESSETPRGFWRADDALVLEFNKDEVVIGDVFRRLRRVDQVCSQTH
jgi:hypothetical protein